MKMTPGPLVLSEGIYRMSSNSFQKRLLSSQEEQESCNYFECVAEDGTVYRVPNWTDEEFNLAGMMSLWQDDDTTAEDIFDG